MDLPAGLTSRPLTLADVPAAVALTAAEEEAALGEVMIEEADLVGDWGVPSFDVATMTVGVEDDGRLVGWAEVDRAGSGTAAVAPEHHGRGIGTALARWRAATARDLGAREVGMPVPQGSPGDRLLEALGWRVRWLSWALELPAGARVPERALPEGYAVRAAEPSEYPQVWSVQEDAFLEWSVRERQPYDDWLAEVTGRPGFEPWQLRVVVDPAGGVASMAWLQLSPTSAYVARLATAAAERGRGLAQALLVDAFAVGREHGRDRSELSTDSRTGALGLYEKVGMVTTSTWVNRGLGL